MTTIKDAPVVEQLIGTEKFPISDGSGKPVTATIQQIIDKCSGIPLVEELDPDAPLGTLVRYKQTVVITKEETITKTGSIRDLNQNLEWDFNSGVNTEGLDTISDINFKIPSNLPEGGFTCGFILYSNSVQLGIQIESQNSQCVVSAFNLTANDHIFILDSETGINDDNINLLKSQLSSEIYYLGTGYPDQPLTEEQFDLIDQFFTFTLKETIKTTEEITKVVPYIKQQHGWESLITENSDFNNDFNLDFN